MKLIQKIALMIVLLIPLGQAFAELTINSLPSRTIRPGEVAVQVVPVKSTEDETYDIKTTSSFSWKVEGPTQVELKKGSLEYLTFITSVPLNARSGVTHDLEIVFTDLAGESFQKTMSFQVAEKRELDFFTADENLTTSSLTPSIPVRISNTGNTNENFSIQINNLTPAVGITLSPQVLTLSAGESRNVNVRLDFTRGESNYAAFEVVASQSSSVLFRKKMQVRVVNHSAAPSDPNEKTIHHQLVMTHDYISMPGDTQNSSFVNYSNNGMLSDYVALSTYLQAQMIDGTGEFRAGRVDLTGDRWRIQAGTQLNPLPGINAYQTQLSGVSGGFNLENGIEVGALVGVNEFTGDTHVGTYAQGQISTNQRLFVIADHNLDRQQTGASAGYQGHFASSDKLSFAPTLIVSDRPERGKSVNYSQVIKYMVRDRMPLVVHSNIDLRERFTRYNNSAQLSFLYKKATLNLGVRSEIEKETGDEGPAFFQDRDNDSLEFYGQIYYPVNDKVSGELSYVQIKTDEFTDLRPTLGLRYQNGGLSAFLQAGATKKNGTNTLGASFDNQFRPLLRLNVQYSKGKVGFQLTGNYEERSEGGSYLNVRSSLNYYLGNDIFESIGLAVGHSSSEQDLFKEDRTYVEVQTKLFAKSDLNVQGYARYERDNLTKENTYYVGVQMNLGAKSRVSRRTEDLFGGRRTADIKGVVCLDTNNNQLCEQNEKRIEGLRLGLNGQYFNSQDNGEFIFYGVAEGKTTLTLNDDELARKSVTLIKDLGLNPKKNQKIEIDVPLTPMSTIYAIGHLDLNENGVLDDEEEVGISGTKIQIFSSEGELVDEAIQRGIQRATLSQLLPGQYTLKVLFPNDTYETTSKTTLQVKLPEQHAELLSFGALIPTDPNVIRGLDQLIIRPENELLFSPEFAGSITLNDNELKLIKNMQVQLFAGETELEVDVRPQGENIWRFDFQVPSGLANAQDIELDLILKVESFEGQRAVVTRSLPFVLIR